GPDLKGYITREPVKIDGDLNKPFWSGPKWQWFTMHDLITGQTPDKNQTKVSFRMTPDKSNLVIGVVCKENKMDKVRAKTQGNNDDPDIFNDDAIEIYIETPERSYFKIVVNSEGKIWDESQDVTIITRDTLPILWKAR
ncbi:sugar-binding protein, partial [Verrucomicrobiota bacterium]